MEWTATVTDVSQLGGGSAQVGVVLSDGVSQKLSRTYVVRDADTLAQKVTDDIATLTMPLVDIPLGPLKLAAAPTPVAEPAAGPV